MQQQRSLVSSLLVLGLGTCSVPLGGLLLSCSTQYSHPRIPVWLSC